MKPDLDYYNFEELVKRWKDHSISISNLLQYGATDKIKIGVLLRSKESLINLVFSSLKEKPLEQDSGTEINDRSLKLHILYPHQIGYLYEQFSKHGHIPSGLYLKAQHVGGDKTPSHGEAFPFELRNLFVPSWEVKRFETIFAQKDIKKISFIIGALDINTRVKQAEIDLEYYSIGNLIDRWSVSEDHLLQWGVSGKLQFYLLATRSNASRYVEKLIDLIGLGSKRPLPCDNHRVTTGTRELYRVDKMTIDCLANPKTESRVQAILLPICDNCPEVKKCDMKDNLTWPLSYRVEPAIKHPEYTCYQALNIAEPDDELVMISKDDLIVTHSEVQRLEKEGIVSRKNTHQGPNAIEAVPSPKKEKWHGQVDSNILLFYKRKSDGKWIIGREDDYGEHDEIEGVRMLQLLISQEPQSISCVTVDNKGEVDSYREIAPPETVGSFEDYIEEKQKLPSQYGGKIKDDLIKERNKQDEFIDKINEELSVTEEPERLCELKKLLSLIKSARQKIQNELDGRKNETTGEINIRTGVQKKIKLALKNICKKTPFMNEYLRLEKGGQTIFTGSACQYRPFDDHNISWVLIDPNN